MRTRFTQATKRAIAMVATIGFLCQLDSASAVSPYDTPYGIQWSYLNGGVNDERNGWIEASSDGTAWFTSGWSSYTGANFDIYGGQGNGGSWDSGYGQISGVGTIKQGKSLPNLTDYLGENQSYTRQSLSMAGTSAMVGWDGRNTASWGPGDPLGSTAGGDFMTVKIDPDGAGPNTEGTLGYKTTTQFVPGYNLRTQAAESNAAGDTVWFSGGYQSVGTDVITVGDGSLPVGSPSYSPWIGKKDAAGNLTGPAKQSNTDGRSYYNALDVNESTNRVFAAGFSYDASGGISTYWDADGDGTADHTTPVGKTDPSFGIFAVYDSNTMAYVGSATFNSDYGDDWFVDVAATPDGGAVAVGYTKGTVSTTGSTNPSLGTDDIYIAKYDGTGALQWDWQSASSDSDRGVSVNVDPDGNIYVGSSVNLLRENASGSSQGTNTNWRVISGDSQVTKFDSAGNVVWNSVLDEGGTLDGIFAAAAYDKKKVYVAGETNPSVLDGGPTWANVNGYVPSGDDRELLVQKVVAGDFNADGLVNQDDVDIVEAALAGGPLAVDTYDFDGDGNSDQDDIDFWFDEILDATAIAGDFNGDAVVDGDDYTLWRSNFGAADESALAEGSGSGGGVDAADYTLWRDNEGRTGVQLTFSPVAAPLGGGAGVPEPGTVALLAGGIGLGLIVLRKSRK